MLALAAQMMSFKFMIVTRLSSRIRGVLSQKLSQGAVLTRHTCRYSTLCEGSGAPTEAHRAGSKLARMGNAGGDRIRAEAPRHEFVGGAYCNYKVNASPPWMRLVITPQRLEFQTRGLARFFARGPWVIPNQQVRQVFAKRRRRILAPFFWDVEIVTTDPSVWWTFWSPRRPEPILLFLEECGYAVDWTPHNWAGLPVE